MFIYGGDIHAVLHCSGKPRKKYTRINSKLTAGNFLNRVSNIFSVTLVKVFTKRWRGFALFGESG